MNTGQSVKLAPQPTSVQDAGDSVSLTRDQLDFFQNQGYISLRQLTTSEEVSGLKASIEDLLKRRVGEKEGAQEDFLAGQKRDVRRTAPQIMNPVNYLPDLHKTACFRNAHAIAKQLLGENATCICDLAIVKEANFGTATPWHQDEAFRDPSMDYHELNIWVALQDVTVKNGCLLYLPESHKNEVMEHGAPNNDPTSQALECIAPFDRDAAVACEIPAGGCTVHHSRMLHSGGPNVTDRPRMAYIMIFGTPPTPAKSPRTYPWLKKRETLAQAQRRRWMLRGGVFVAAWRKVRRGDFKSWGAAIGSITRSFRNMRSNY